MNEFFFDQVDYTSRDYASIKDDLISRIPSLIPEWTTRDPSDFGITMIELMSYMGDVIHFHVDRAANDSYLDTATTRSAVVALAKAMDYTPTEMLPAVTTLTFANATAGSLVVPKGTRVATILTSVNSDVVQIAFETDAALTVLAAGTANVTATQGKTTIDEALGTSNGSVGQFYQLYNLPVLDGSVAVKVSGQEWQYVEHLYDYSYSDQVFTVETTDDLISYVRFGEGIHGRVPPLNAPITSTYRTGNGSDGNVKTGTLSYIVSTVPIGITSVTNASSAYGGSDRESIMSIKQNAPLSFYGLNRAVTTKDYANLTLRVPGIGKASAKADVYTSVNLYIAPYVYTGVGASVGLKNAVQTFLADKIPVGTTVTVLDPTYVDITVSITVQTLPQYRRSLVARAVTAALTDLFSYPNLSFEDTLSQLYLMATIDGVKGVMNVNVDQFCKTATTGVVGTLTFAKNEIPRLQTVNLTVTADAAFGLPDA